MKIVSLVVVANLVAAVAPAQDATSRAVEHTVATLPNSVYFVVPPRTTPAKGKQGPLLVVLPGGAGTRDFLPWVENGIGGQVSDDCTVVLITAVQWQPDQVVVWPTERNKVPGMKYSTEAYVRAVVADVEKSQSIDPRRRVVLAWSSSGPAVHPMLATKDSPFTRAYIAMSIWPGEQMGDLSAVKGRRFLLDQSPADQVTKFAHVHDAFAALTKAGAIVRLSTHAGGHAWNDAPLPRLHEGLRWLLSDEPAPKPEWPADDARAGDELVANGGFEQGTAGWRAHDHSHSFVVALDKKQKKEGKQAVRLTKTAASAMPDYFTQDIDDLRGAAQVTVRAFVRSRGAKDVAVRVLLYAGTRQVHDDVDLVRLDGDTDWKLVERTWKAMGADRALIEVALIGTGEIWLDAVSILPAK